MEKIQPYRQPLVTATGIFLGFMLDFVNGWMPTSFTIYKIRDAIIAVGSLSSIALLIMVLYRILKLNVSGDFPPSYYRKTLRFFIVGISIPFFSMVVILLRRLVMHIV